MCCYDLFVTDEEYRRALDLMFIEVNDAVQVFYTYLAMSEVSVEDRRLFQMLNRDPLFWRIQAYCLQTTFFIIFSASSILHLMLIQSEHS